MPSPTAWMQRAIDFAGSQWKLADLVGYTQNAVHYAVSTGKVPPMMAYRIEVATSGRIRAVDLCPLLDAERQMAAARKDIEAERRAKMRRPA